MVANDWFLQFLADILGIPVERPENVESTVLGAAYLAAYKAGIIRTPEQICADWECDQRFEPAMTAERRDVLLDGWKKAVSRIRTNG
jgi:glycerol kinase